MTPPVYIGLGSNLGDRLGHLETALLLLAERGAPWVERSACHQSEPVGRRGQPWFLNAVCRVQTRLDPMRLLDACLAVEAELGRVRAARWGPRTIDLDLLFYGDAVISLPRLSIPHPRLADRKFVLEPLCELAPDFRDPVSGLTVRQLHKACADASRVEPAAAEFQWSAPRSA